jgi:BlaI family transcriptional regulator, penicillinase repressor
VPKPERELGPLERRIMEALWKQGIEATVRDLLDAPGVRGHAYTTIMTVADRLKQKGFVSRRRVGRAYVYRAARSREEHIQGLVQQTLSGWKDRRSVLLGFLRGVDDADLGELRRLIRELERERDGREPS